MSTAPKSSPATSADLLALPEEGRGFELIGGEIAEKQAGFHHSHAQRSLGGVLHPFDRRQRGGGEPGGWWLLSEQLVRFSEDLLRPDLSGWRRERLAEPADDDDAVIEVVPDWICEIISPRNAGNDLIRKKRIFHKHRVHHYWIVDPRDRSLTVLRFSADGYVEVLLAQQEDRVRAEPFGEIELHVGALFGDDETP